MAKLTVSFTEMFWMSHRVHTFSFFFWGGGGVFHDIPKMAVKETTKLTGNLKEASGGKDKIKGENENI